METLTWQDAEKVADDANVHAALENFSIDPTGAAGVCVILAVAKALAEGGSRDH